MLFRSGRCLNGFRGFVNISLLFQLHPLVTQRFYHLLIVNGINPYIDRILNEVHKLTERGYIDHEKIKKEKYQYIDELVTTINEYNDILALWIKMKQGTLSLNIETFDLNELFELLGKGRRAFEMKNQKLEIESPTCNMGGIGSCRQETIPNGSNKQSNNTPIALRTPEGKRK